ncbi:glycogen synthase [Desulfatibacillum aliphaticivorans]|uniref:glycogen synthase n=1 Tax=Desulfatibacillum aliphaticivorans TaxID=218208 RepID=UPI00041EC2C6|nr:glycogen/starch synthase [Desulfatibacillum aliphaticivorans]
MVKDAKKPRVLIVTPEVTYLPPGMGNMANYFRAKAGGLADVSAALVSALFKQGADVHVALPDFRTVFYSGVGPVMRKELSTIRSNMPEDRIHLAEDRAFFYQSGVYSNYPQENFKISLAFQREVINHIIPQVQPDLIHCNDWMTGLIPGQARWMGIPCLFTIHNIHTEKYTLEQIEDRGVDAASFWQGLFYERPPENYEESRNNNKVDFLTSGVFGAHFVNTVSQTFLMEIIEGQHHFIQEPIKQELANKWHADCATGILNAPDPSYNPATDKSLPAAYGPDDHVHGKLENKRYIQQNLGLLQDDNAPIFFWPSRLDPVQKGCQLLADIMYDVISKYWDNNLQIVVVANGEYQKVFRDIVLHHGFEERVAVQNFDERLSRIAFAASDFVLMPSSFEPCGLPQMIGAIYGSLPVAHDTGGLHDTVWQMNTQQNKGNGFLYRFQDTHGLWWAIDRAMDFYFLSPEVREAQVARVMRHGKENFNHEVNARAYIDLYEKMLHRPLIGGGGGKKSSQSSSDGETES